MPLLSPNQIQEVQKALRPSRPSIGTIDESELSELLEQSGLSTREALTRLEELMVAGETGAIRLRAAEMALKLNGLLNKDSEQNQPINVNIVIRDFEFQGINPILIPR